MRHSLTLIYLSYTNIVVYEIMDAPSYVDLFIAGAVFFFALYYRITSRITFHQGFQLLCIVFFGILRIHVPMIP